MKRAAGKGEELLQEMKNHEMYSREKRKPTAGNENLQNAQ